MAEPKKLSKSTLNKCFWTWEWTYQACYNYENMQGGCFLDAMAPAIRELYADDPDEFKAAAARHFEFYNIENTTGGGVLGLVLAMEEQRASGEDVTEDAIRSIKTGLMGPLSGVGDSYMQGVIYPIILAIGCAQGVLGNTAVPIIVILLQAIIQITIARFMFNLGYNKGSDALLDLLESGTFKNLLSGAGILGCMVLGALIMNFVSVHTGIIIPMGEGVEPFSLQTGLFDTILPGLLSLAATLMCYALVSKGWSSTKVLLLLVVIGVVGSVTGILA